jgi:hypothetical protein
MNSDYERFHRNRTNLVLHIVAVPLFAVCFLASAWFFLNGNFLTGILLLAGAAIPLAVQGYGHRLEAIPPEPFHGPGNFLKRIFAEQFFGFWAFLFSGGWASALRGPERHGGN